MEPELFKGEEIKDVEGYEGLYAVTSLGRVWSYPNTSHKKGKWLKPTNINGYLYVNLYKNNENYNKRIHRLVAETFLPNTNNYPTVDHIDRNTLNNDISNLRWATIQMQMNNRENSEKWKKACEISIKKATEATKKKVRCIETNIIYESVHEASRETKTEIGNISSVCSGKRKTAGGYHWEFVEGEAE